VADGTSEQLVRALRLVAPGQALRDGLDRILQAKRGALIVVGDDPGVLSLCTGGFLLDSEFSPQRLGELAKMDGAIILAPDASRIARANVHLTPKASVPTTETGTRHRTAERVARSLDVPVLTVSAAMSTIAVFAGASKRVLIPTARLVDRANQALATLERFRDRFDTGVVRLSMVEVEDAVSVGDVVGVLQPAEVIRRLGGEVSDALVELGDEGRLISLQMLELVEGVAETAELICADYVVDGDAQVVLARLEALPTDRVRDPASFALALGLLAGDDLHVSPRGYRMLDRVPKMPPPVIERLVARFATLPGLLTASLKDLEAVEGVGEARAREIRTALSRQVETSVLQRFD
jgi:diadenylate cyclase